VAAAGVAVLIEVSVRRARVLSQLTSVFDSKWGQREISYVR